MSWVVGQRHKIIDGPVKAPKSLTGGKGNRAEVWFFSKQKKDCVVNQVNGTKGKSRNTKGSHPK